jgi:hypothetical protein
MKVSERFSWCCEELVALKKRIDKVKRKVSSELKELKRRGLDVKDPVVESVRQYSLEVESVEKEVVKNLENCVRWAKLELTESKIRYERGKRGLKEGEIY